MGHAGFAATIGWEASGRVNVNVEELKDQRKETVRPDRPLRTQLNDALMESYATDFI